MQTAQPCQQVLLEFDPKLNNLGKGKHLADGLSAVVQIGNTLWLAHDETITIERLTLDENSQNGQLRTLDHRQFSLQDFLKLPVAVKNHHDTPAEIDIEGLAYADGYLWLVGSHSLKRKKPKSDRDVDSNQNRLATIVREGNRYLVARIPVTKKKGVYALTKNCKHRGESLSAASLHGNEHGNELTEALKNDPHLAAFLNIPGKDNGFDIEGLAAKNKRLFLGLRGPVLRGWAVILEIEPDESSEHLKAIGPKQSLYRKHFLQLNGLGIRDICFQNQDLLILAGPCIDMDGSVCVFRRQNASTLQAESIINIDHLQKIIDIPFGHGDDHPEGMPLFYPPVCKSPTLPIVNDGAAKQR